jgi:hypothetical protein
MITPYIFQPATIRCGQAILFLNLARINYEPEANQSHLNAEAAGGKNSVEQFSGKSQITYALMVCKPGDERVSAFPYCGCCALYENLAASFGGVYSPYYRLRPRDHLLPTPG